MRNRLKCLLWIFSLCLVVSCAHKEDSSRKVSQQPTPAAPAAAPAAKTAAPAAVPSTGSAPAIQLAETNHNFGNMSEDRQYEHEFKVKNTGGGVLEIKKVLPG